MKKIQISRTLLAVALMGSFVVAPLMAPMAQADPPRNAPAYGRRAKDKKENRKERREDRREDRKERREDRREDREDRRDDDDRDDRYDRNRYDNDRDYRDRYNRNPRNNRNSANFSGTVTNVRSGNSFDLSANGRTYNVYTSSDLPRGLSRGDEVRVYGRPYGTNDIRNATVRVTDNNRNDPRRDDNNDGNRYQTFSGVVTNLRNNREFDIRVGGTTYNVYANNEVRNLSNNDQVRIYGQRVGSNDIRNASVSIIRNR